MYTSAEVFYQFPAWTDETRDPCCRLPAGSPRRPTKPPRSSSQTTCPPRTPGPGSPRPLHIFAHHATQTHLNPNPSFTPARYGLYSRKNIPGPLGSMVTRFVAVENVDHEPGASVVEPSSVKPL